MKLVCLNTWGCRIAEPVFDFIRRNSDADVFCLQEIMRGGIGITDKNERKNSYKEIQDLLPLHSGYFAKYINGSHYGEEPSDYSFGLSTFIRSDFRPSFYKSVELLDPDRKWGDYTGRFAGGVALAINVEDVTIINIHGLWQDMAVEDTEAKIEESNKLVSLSKETNSKKILCGDFNLTLDTRAISIIENSYLNQIKRNNISDTRGPLYKNSNRFADYIFTDPSIQVESLEVPCVSISDHLPLIMNFS